MYVILEVSTNQQVTCMRYFMVLIEKTRCYLVTSYHYVGSVTIRFIRIESLLNCGLRSARYITKENMVFKTGLINFIVITNKKTWEVILGFLVLENEKKTKQLQTQAILKDFIIYKHHRNR